MPVKDDVFILAASPHAQGTTTTLAQLLQHSLQEETNTHFLSLYDMRLAGCLNCGFCKKPPHSCVLQKGDDCEQIFSALWDARQVIWLSPVYFYGLPAQAKALVDRSQRFYERNMGRLNAVKPTRKGVSLFVSGRPKGKLLFTGSHLGVKYFFSVLGTNHVLSLGLHGVENKNDISLETKKDLRRLATMLLEISGEEQPRDVERTFTTLQILGGTWAATKGVCA